MATSRPAPRLDAVDWQLIDQLQADGRLSYNELARRVHLSAPAVAERVRRLEESGVISGYRADIDPTLAGYPMVAFVQMRCSLGSCLLKTSRADDFPEVTEIHKLSGAHCSMLKVRASSVAHLEGLIEDLGKHGELSTHVVLSTQYDNRDVPQPPSQPRTVTPSEGWTR